MTTVLRKDEVVIGEVIAKAREVFQQYGFKKTTMEDIARELGKGKSTLYYYFSSKEAIFEEVVDQEMHRFFQLIRKAVGKSQTGREKLKAYSKMRLNRINEMCNLSHALKNDLIENIGAVLEIKRKHDSTHEGIVRDIILFGVNDGEFRKLSPRDIDLISFLFVSLFKGMGLPTSSRSTVDLNRHVGFMVDSLVDGIGNTDAPKGSQGTGKQLDHFKNLEL
jgi:AcrR family transcriptional regulator